MIDLYKNLTEISTMNHKEIVPAGQYYLGDPCYAIQSQDIWSACCDQWFEDSRPAKAIIKNSFVLAFNTKYGDGTYKDQFGNFFSVDSGCIGLVPIELSDTDPGDLMIKVDFDKDTVCISNTNGVLQFGKHIINTGLEDEEE